MSTDKKRWPAAEANNVAIELVRALRPYCAQIEIAGSLRRKKPDVGDVEILYVPLMETRPDGLFDTKQVNLADEQIERWLNDRTLEKRPNVNGIVAWGAKNKLAIHVGTTIPVDLFATTRENWYVSLVIRTGSKDTNLRLTNGAIRQGARLNAYGSGITWSDGTTSEAKSEQDVFKFCGVPYLETEKR